MGFRLIFLKETDLWFALTIRAEYIYSIALKAKRSREYQLGRFTDLGLV